jgi:hypothetical protein
MKSLNQKKLEAKTMNTRAALLAAGCVALMAPGGCRPDLVVVTIETTGPSSIDPEDHVEVPVRVVVRNQGNAAAGGFKVSFQYTGGVNTPDTNAVVPFTDAAGQVVWYPGTGTSSPLSAGKEVTFEGKLLFGQAEHGVTVSLTAMADSCRGDEFMPEYCRVQESNEGNNTSTTIPIVLP